MTTTYYQVVYCYDEHEHFSAFKHSTLAAAREEKRLFITRCCYKWSARIEMRDARQQEDRT